MKYVLIKKIVLFVSQINKKQSFTGWGGASRGPKGWGWGEKVFPIMRDGAGMGQDKTMRGGDEDPIHQPRPAPLPSLFTPKKLFGRYPLYMILNQIKSDPKRETSLLVCGSVFQVVLWVDFGRLQWVDFGGCVYSGRWWLG